MWFQPLLDRYTFLSETAESFVLSAHKIKCIVHRLTQLTELGLHRYQRWASGPIQWNRTWYRHGNVSPTSRHLSSRSRQAVSRTWRTNRFYTLLQSGGQQEVSLGWSHDTAETVAVCVRACVCVCAVDPLLYCWQFPCLACWLAGRGSGQSPARAHLRRADL